MVARSLRKGRASVYFWHSNTGHSIGAENYTCELVESELIVSFKLRPADENQSDDEEYSMRHPIEYVEISDGYVLDGLSRYFEHRKTEVRGWKLNIKSKWGARSLLVTPRVSHLHTVQFMVGDAGG